MTRAGVARERAGGEAGGTVDGGRAAAGLAEGGVGGIMLVTVEVVEE